MERNADFKTTRFKRQRAEALKKEKELRKKKRDEINQCYREYLPPQLRKNNR